MCTLMISHIYFFHVTADTKKLKKTEVLEGILETVEDDGGLED